MPASALVVALLAAPLPALEIAVDAAHPRALPDGQRVVLVVTARNAGREDVVFLPRAVSVTFTGAGARLQRYDEGPALPPLTFGARTVPRGASTTVEIVATPSDGAWQVSAGAGLRANWFLPRPAKVTAVVKYSVPEGASPPGITLPAGVVWTGELQATPVVIELPP